MTFESIYDLLNGPTEIKKQHFVEYFSGDQLDTERWVASSYNGSGGSEKMIDEIDEGFEILATNGEGRAIDTNNIRQFDQDACTIISVWRAADATDVTIQAGLSDVRLTAPGNNRALSLRRSIGGGFFELETTDSTSNTRTSSSITRDELWHKHQVTLDGVNATLYLDDTLEATHSTNYPQARLQPFFVVTAPGSGPDQYLARIRYMEAFNF